MDREYDIFENVEGQHIWRCSVVGHEAAIGKLKEMAAMSHHEFIVMHLPTKSVIARMPDHASGL
jgi:hypothetical protein